MAAQEISDYLKNGNIAHSVNMPEVHQPRAGGKRICIIHKNEPGMISQITALTTEAGLNIENMMNKSKKNMAYTMLDATGAVDGKLAEKPRRHPGAHPVTRRSSPNLFIRKEPPPARAAALCGSGGKKYLKK